MRRIMAKCPWPVIMIPLAVGWWFVLADWYAGQPLIQFEMKRRGVAQSQAFSISPDGRQLLDEYWADAVDDCCPALDFWDLVRGVPIRMSIQSELDRKEFVGLAGSDALIWDDDLRTVFHRYYDQNILPRLGRTLNHGYRMYPKQAGFCAGGHYFYYGEKDGRPSFAQDKLDGDLAIDDILTGQRRATLRNAAPPVAISPDGRLAVTMRVPHSAWDPFMKLVVWDFALGQELRVIPGPSWQKRLTFSPDGSYLFAETESKTIRPHLVCCWNLSTGRQIAHVVSGTGGQPYDRKKDLDQAGGVVAAVNPVIDDKTPRRGVFFWRPSHGETAAPAEFTAPPTFFPYAIVLSADGRIAALQCRETSLQSRIERPTRRWVRWLNDDPDLPISRGVFLILDTTTLQELARFPGHAFQVSADGRQVFGSTDRRAAVWDVQPSYRRAMRAMLISLAVMLGVWRLIGFGRLLRQRRQARAAAERTTAAD